MSYNMCWMLPLVILAILMPQFESFDMKEAQYLVKDDKNQFYVAGRGTVSNTIVIRIESFSLER